MLPPVEKALEMRNLIRDLPTMRRCSERRVIMPLHVEHRNRSLPVVFAIQCPLRNVDKRELTWEMERPIRDHKAPGITHSE